MENLKDIVVLCDKDGAWINKLLVSLMMSQMAKNLRAMQETWVWSLGQEDPPEKEMAIHSSILAWRIPWTEEPAWQATVHGVAKSQTQLSE